MTIEGSLWFSASRLLIEQVEAVRAEGLHDFGVNPHDQAFLVQQVAAVLQATQQVSVLKGQLANGALGLVEALAAHITLGRLLTSSECDLGG